ncbi:MAG: N-acyl amino acid synthase FeeM domain-containing protein [Rhodanobacteraceae bacterium]
MTVIDIAARLARSTVRSSEPPCVCATSLEQVESAWKLVYERYSQMGLIDENPFGIHAVPTAVGSHASVIWGPEGPEVGYTMTLFRDNPMGLALDSVYARYLDEFRRKGRRLLEVGMLADRRRCVSRGVGALFSMMRWAIHFGLHNDLTDIVIGVHPRHAEFYVRCYGLEEFAPPTSYPLVRNNPVVPLRLRLRESLANDVLPRGLADARDNPIPTSAFAHPFAFEPKQLHGSLIAGLLKARYGIDPEERQTPAEPTVVSRSQRERCDEPSRVNRLFGASPALAAV